MNRRLFINSLIGTSAAGAALAAGCVYGEDTHLIEVKRVPLTLGLGQPIRMAVLGDIHFDPICDEAYVAHAVELVNGLDADLVLFTGDFITAHADRVYDLADILSQVRSKLGVFAVPGNHEHWTGYEYIVHAMETRAKMRVLCNENVQVPGEENLYVTGLDSFWAGRPDKSILQRTPPGSRHIVLVHEPDSFWQLDDPRIRLQISGHTHGGQVRVPLYGALVLPQLGHDFETGLYVRDGRTIYVNRGIGTLTPHVRINCRPEITVFELT